MDSPKEIPLEEFAAMSYPATVTDKAICAAALSIVGQFTVLSNQDHLDALVLATHPDWCRVFLTAKEQTEFATARKSANRSLFVKDSQPIRWRECRDHLERQQAILISRIDNDQRISLGPNAELIKAALPEGTDVIVGYAVKAMKRVAEMRQGLLSITETQKKMIEAMEERHRIYRLAI